MQKSDDVCIRYLMREMDPSEEIEFEREMMADENLLIEVESLRKTYQKLGKLPVYEAPKDLISKITSDAIKAQKEEINRSKKWTANLSRFVAAAAVAILVVSTGVYFAGNEILPNTPTEIVDSNSNSGITPWVDRSNNLHFAGTSIKEENPQQLQLEVDQSFSKLKLINSDTGFTPSSRKIVLTSTKR